MRWFFSTPVRGSVDAGQPDPQQLNSMLALVASKDKGSKSNLTTSNTSALATSPKNSQHGPQTEAGTQQQQTQLTQPDKQLVSGGITGGGTATKSSQKQQPTAGKPSINVTTNPLDMSLCGATPPCGASAQNTNVTGRGRGRAAGESTNFIFLLIIRTKITFFILFLLDKLHPWSLFIFRPLILTRFQIIIYPIGIFSNVIYSFRLFCCSNGIIDACLCFVTIYVFFFVNLIFWFSIDIINIARMVRMCERQKRATERLKNWRRRERECERNWRERQERKKSKMNWCSFLSESHPLVSAIHSWVRLFFPFCAIGIVRPPPERPPKTKSLQPSSSYHSKVHLKFRSS